MKVQRIRLPETNHVTWLVLDDAYHPIEPIRVYLTFRRDIGCSPFTIQAEAHHLKLFWEYLRDGRLDWTAVDVAQLAAFISWLRRPAATPIPLHAQRPRRTEATIDQILGAVHTFYDFHARMKTVPDLALYHFLALPHRRYKPFLYGIAHSTPRRTRVLIVKREKTLAKTLTREEVGRLIAACHHVRDRFLLRLLHDTGMRIGQALGLRHEDIAVEDRAIRIVPRDDNANGARAKTRVGYATYPGKETIDLYIQYVVEDLGAFEAEHLPDYVFINLWDGEIGRPMTYAAVRSLFRRLGRAMGIRVTPHMFRHTRATEWLRDDKLPLATVSRLLGHTSIATTHDIYVHLTDDDLRAALEATARRGTAHGR